MRAGGPDQPRGRRGRRADGAGADTRSISSRSNSSSPKRAPVSTKATWRKAAELARRALGIEPDNAAASALLEEISAIEREERERVVKERAIALAIDKCRDAALAGDAEGVVAAAEEVLALDSGHAEARELMAEARSLIEARAARA